jgi:acyl-CoA thioesterase-1
MTVAVNGLRRARGRGLAAAAALAVFMALATAAAAAQQTVLMLGDSLTAGYGLDKADTVPVKLEAELRRRGFDVLITNGGVSGDTTKGGAARLDWLMADGAPDVLVIELGGNDGLRAIDPADTRANLVQAIETGIDAGAVVVLAGMYAPPNLGADYEAAFNAVFTDLAAAYPVVFYPFFLDGVAGDPALNQDDGIHPNPAGVDVIVERFAPVVADALQRAAQPAGDS